MATLQQVCPCKRCNTQAGWYEKRVTKYLQFFEANGDAFGTSNMERIKGGERKFCTSCNADITDQLQTVE